MSEKKECAVVAKFEMNVSGRPLKDRWLTAVEGLPDPNLALGITCNYASERRFGNDFGDRRMRTQQHWISEPGLPDLVYPNAITRNRREPRCVG
jgi:hypothetical protein